MQARRGILIELEAPEELPVVQADTDRLAQALDNLLNDGLKLVQPWGKIVLRLHAFVLPYQQAV